MEHGAEVQQINGELAILRARLETYRQSASMLRRFFTFVIPAVILVLAIRVFLYDVLLGVFFAGMALVCVAFIALLPKSFGIRWIDLAAMPFGNRFVSRIYQPLFFYPDASPKPRNDVELLEMQIAERERRLSELGA
jgi:hypothetical protein